MDDLEQKLKEGLLEDLIDHMSSGMGDKLKPKGLAVEVAAPDKDKLAQGLDKAKDVLGTLPSESNEESSENELPSDLEGTSHDSDSDEARLLQLLQDDDDEDDQKLRA